LRLERTRVGYEGRRVALAEQAAQREQPMMGGALPAGVTGERALEGVPQGVATTVRMITDYKMPLPSGMALRTPYWQNVLQLAGAYDPTFDASQYEARRRTRTDFASGKAAGNIRSLNTAVGHLDTLRKRADALNNSSFDTWNAIANWGLSRVGDPRVRDFSVAATAVEGELASLFKGTGATDQEIKQWRASLDASQSPDQLKAALDTATELLASRLEALRNQYQTGMGKAPDFKVLSDKSRQLLKGAGVDVDALDPLPQAGPGAAAGGGTVQMKDPQGRTLWVPANEVQEALALGAVVVVNR
jgi:hypothetical protein